MEKSNRLPESRVGIMKPKYFTVVALLTFGFASAGCKTLPQSRVLRLMPTTDRTEWRLNVNGEVECKVIKSVNLKSSLESLHLQHGDLVLFGKIPWDNSDQSVETGSWLMSYFDSRKVAMFVYPSSRTSDVFSVPTYHWVAPFENPRNLEEASFFFEGRFFGAGMGGYQRMVHEIKRGSRPRIFVLGSLYDINSGLGPNESPYENLEQLLNDALKKSGTELLRPSELPWF